jgi:hypothetical protein
MDGFAYGIPKFATVLEGRTLCDPRLLDATTGMRLAATRCEVMGVGIPLPRLPKLKETFGVIRITLAALVGASKGLPPPTWWYRVPLGAPPTTCVLGK